MRSNAVCGTDPSTASEAERAIRRGDPAAARWRHGRRRRERERHDGAAGAVGAGVRPSYVASGHNAVAPKYHSQPSHGITRNRIVSFGQHYAYPYGGRNDAVNRNVGTKDERVRTAAGALAGTASIAILSGALSLPTAIAPVLGVVAIVMFATAATGNCPAYSLLGVDSCSRSSRPE